MKRLFLFVFIAVLAFGSAIAFADNDNARGQGSGQKAPFKPQEVFEQLKAWEKGFKLPDISEIGEGRAQKSFVISASGNVKITDAEVLSVSGTTFAVKVWGLNIPVRTSSSTSFVVGKLRDWSFSEMKIGDKVDVMGDINEVNGSVEARVINAKISAPRIGNEEVSRLRSVVEGLIRQLQEALRKVGKPLPPGISPVPSASPTPSV
ncbi:MAG: hypothetical protein A2418_01670 [Candidatus Brennerbacteria bacterium RIFOXYC1_FULL_41_11]|uniref:DUF5666 domain-containing protein n=1 Tax=Candidatus Brennerbacteria bacterium RIFOXYD1_FULL_41_16 TaxID=1797529 RepID=A0A1G1XKC6_9BACT|nr:MAG: hypothetical protein UU61_C0015G0003 [Parcubacteria group bacterium GW2011_GWB1_41_4]OGY38885.1 MAG: hypothetical protein A2391_03170 [Candidatus Brennerbacteria bacterium RIFOXYB1_FULL_41_13]OGY38947.1 MAG: hypothetical protein A2418_01670 [Candidatus Brennerbacteria bacterium RIFOXYC1_FULL_41_11]OGY40060.1 MAG: hypothetical protein A2570_01495 [Candidatus Brennerbacteria bacterium RIFOXYD1_FULL_41_16]